jgi:cystathionine beta-lyase/cystathionine gamma-synthase
VMAREFMTLGAIPGPHDAWLLMRGMRTLELRMRRSAESGPRVARFLEAHPKVRQVNWPYLESFPQHTLAKTQMSGCPGLMSVRLHAADVAAVERFCDALRRFLMAVSWGGHESLIFPMAAVTDPAVPDAVLPWDLVRIYVGLEDPELLIADLEQALTRV